MDLITSWKENQENNKKKLEKFLYSTSFKNEELDDKVSEINKEIVSKINCLDCGNCCKTTVTTFTNQDINRISNFLNISKKELIKKYLIDDMGEYTTATTPCPFLEKDNKCSIYEVRPEACSSYPHTQRKGFNTRRYAHHANIEICPITYHVLMRLSESIQ